MLKALFIKYKEVILYLFFGGCTTLVNWVVYWLACDVCGLTLWDTQLANAIAWVAAVAFAYVTNKLWVFESRDVSGKTLAYEIGTFVSARLLSLGFEALTLFVGVTCLGWNNYLVKIIASVFVVIINYVASKLVIFRKREAKNDTGK